MATSKKSHLNLLLIPAVISFVFVVLSFTPFSQLLDRGLYDVFLHLKPPIAESKEIVLLDVDDLAINNLGAWPWPRNYTADGLLTLREVGARYAVFDIEYLNKSPAGIDRQYLENGLKRDFDLEFNGIGSDVNDLFSALASKNITLRDAPPYVTELYDRTQTSKTELYKKTQQVAVNNDLYLGQAMKFFGGAYITLNRQYSVAPASKENEAPSVVQDREDHEKLRKIVSERFSYPFQGSESRVGNYNDFFIPLESLITRAKGAGLTNVEIDEDGKRRRIRLFENINGKYYAQLVFSPLLDYLGNPKVTISSDRIDLEGAHYPDGSVHNVSIPLDSKGMMLINWLPQEYNSSFRHVSFYDLVIFKRQVDDLADYLAQLSDRDGWKVYSGENVAQRLSQQLSDIDELKKKAVVGESEDDVNAYLTAKKQWADDIESFVNGSVQSELLAAVSNSKGDSALIQAEMKTIRELFENLKIKLDDYKKTQQILTERLKGSLCIIGWSGTGTSDLGVTPFQQQYVNIGTHASVANTILQRSFLQEVPSWYSLVLTVVLSVGLVFFLRNLSPLRQNVFGLGAVVLIFAAAIVFFLVTGIYFPILSPTLSVFLSFVIYSLVRFFASEQEKSFLRKAFSTYLSGDVINQLVSNPEMLKLGGQKKVMTAMFTDVKGFSTISEVLDPVNLVQLLNHYLSGMSDIVLNQGGTIDKFEGDAIIAFWGAPLELPTHAKMACTAAIRMKQLETEMNQRFIAEGLAPTPLLTRIGVNTGEMVVGNMGTERKMDYTIMGNTVNLAARLEGVNKQYGTWILTTDFTKAEAGDDFLTRRLDRVRVVGINQPVQLHEVLAIKSEALPETIQLVDEFHSALTAFEKRNWPQAEKLFEAILKKHPEDGPSSTYLKRCKEYQIKPRPDSWDGVFNLTEK